MFGAGPWQQFNPNAINHGAPSQNMGEVNASNQLGNWHGVPGAPGNFSQAQGVNPLMAQQMQLQYQQQMHQQQLQQAQQHQMNPQQLQHLQQQQLAAQQLQQQQLAAQHLQQQQLVAQQLQQQQLTAQQLQQQHMTPQLQQQLQQQQLQLQQQQLQQQQQIQAQQRQLTPQQWQQMNRDQKPGIQIQPWQVPNQQIMGLVESGIRSPNVNSSLPVQHQALMQQQSIIQQQMIQQQQNQQKGIWTGNVPNPSISTTTSQAIGPGSSQPNIITNRPPEPNALEPLKSEWSKGPTMYDNKKKKDLDGEKKGNRFTKSEPSDSKTPIKPDSKASATNIANVPMNISDTPSSKDKKNAEEILKEEKDFEKHFQEWEAQFSQWKEQNKCHPDREAYNRYEKQWKDWRDQLLQRREQMRNARSNKLTDSTLLSGKLVLAYVTLSDGYQGSKNASPTFPTHSFSPIINRRYYPARISRTEDDEENGGEPSDYRVWSAIATSLARWREMKKRKAHKSHVHRRDEEIVCYRSVGCFRDEGPFDYLDTLPQPPEAVGTRFWLFTRELREQSEPIRYDDNGTSLHRSRFNASRAVKIIIHGFGGSGHRPWVKQMTEKLLQVVDTNVIVIDWEKGASLPNYVQAAANVQLVGRQVARLIELLNVASGVENKNIHIIGFSLGAHVAGYAGMETKNLGRISGLDPASPLFEGYDFKAKLDPSDAHFVDIIHSSADSFLRGGLGAFESMGHVDFYPNGGKAQLGCNSVFMGALTDIFYRDWQSLCNHRRAFKFFTDSIEPSCSFPAFPCDNFDKFVRGHCFTCPPKGVPVVGGRTCGRMGYYSDKYPARGKLYLITREKEPFCANQFKIVLTNTKGQGKTWGKLEVTFFAQIGDNETFLLSMESEEIDDTQPIQGVVIAHPVFRNLTGVTVRYNKYKGWIYSGKEEWHLNKLHIENSDGQKYTYCGYRTAIKDKEPRTLPLTPGECKVDSTPHRESRLIWKVIGDPVKGPKTGSYLYGVFKRLFSRPKSPPIVRIT